MGRDTCVCVFFKPPVAGTVKTRLIPTLGAEVAATLAEAFFRDTWNCAESLNWAIPIIASTDLLDADVFPYSETQVWLQGDRDLGARIERILTRALSHAPLAMVLGADSPGLPASFLDRAHEAWLSADAVLGPCDDGGFYLLGLRKCPPDLLKGIHWSQSTTFVHTLDRLNGLGLKTSVLDRWYDVDRREDLDRLSSDITAGAIAAPHTARVLVGLRAIGVTTPVAPSDARLLNSELDGARVR